MRMINKTNLFGTLRVLTYLQQWFAFVYLVSRLNFTSHCLGNAQNDDTEYLLKK